MCVKCVKSRKLEKGNKDRIILGGEKGQDVSKRVYES